MDSITLGRRIKEARLAKKMTQNEVVGNFITRNMLSQIESGTASPSIKTLEYLSQVLEIPVDQLMLPEEKTKEISVCLTDSVSENSQMPQPLLLFFFLLLSSPHRHRSPLPVHPCTICLPDHEYAEYSAVLHPDCCAQTPETFSDTGC